MKKAEIIVITIASLITLFFAVIAPIFKIWPFDYFTNEYFGQDKIIYCKATAAKNAFDKCTQCINGVPKLYYATFIKNRDDEYNKCMEDNSM